MPAINLLVKEVWVGNKLKTYEPLGAHDKNEAGRLRAMQDARRLAQEVLRSVATPRYEELHNERCFTASVETTTGRIAFIVRHVKSGREKKTFGSLREKR